MPKGFGTWQTGSSPVRTESNVGRDTSGVITDFAKNGQALSLGYCNTFRRNFLKSREFRQMLPNGGRTARDSVVWEFCTATVRYEIVLCKTGSRSCGNPAFNIRATRAASTSPNSVAKFPRIPYFVAPDPISLAVHRPGNLGSDDQPAVDVTGRGRQPVRHPPQGGGRQYYYRGIQRRAIIELRDGHLYLSRRSVQADRAQTSHRRQPAKSSANGRMRCRVIAHPILTGSFSF